MLNMHDIDERLTDCFKVVLPNLPATQLQDASIASVADWDSMATITLISLIEESFGVRTEPEDIEHLTSFESIRQYLQQKMTACHAE
jgi:acyl carrier protein